MTLAEIEDKLNKSLETMDCVDLFEDGTVYMRGDYNASDLKKIYDTLISLPTLLKA